ncbi:hypothetical protein [Pseudooceanicola marinus]|uniref:hypothetical protein n=1 Tax=Pseudooceanicola marinus TaxID=396013 RepID=UPI001CD4A668|nr:hypothetical protein [Pseudooceanicola marinus]MCA1335153.1 hypothetical protein [Pseudooceanicola marinus]
MLSRRHFCRTAATALFGAAALGAPEGLRAEDTRALALVLRDSEKLRGLAGPEIHAALTRHLSVKVASPEVLGVGLAFARVEDGAVEGLYLSDPFRVKGDDVWFPGDSFLPAPGFFSKRMPLTGKVAFPGDSFFPGDNFFPGDSFSPTRELRAAVTEMAQAPALRDGYFAVALPQARGAQVAPLMLQAEAR